MKFTCRRKICYRRLETPVEHPVHRGRPRGSRTRSSESPRRDLLGFDSKRYPKIPVELANQLQSLTKSMLRELFKLLQRSYESGIDGVLLELLEEGLPAFLTRFGRELMQAQLEQERGHYGPRIKDRDGDILEYEGDRKKSVLTPLGEVSFRRSYYRGSGKRIYPLDQLLGITEHAVLPGLQQSIALLSSRTSFPDATDLLNRLLPLSISLKRVENIAQTLATNVQQSQERRVKETLDPCANLPTVRQARTTVLAIDGGMCRVRDEDESHREFKLAALGTLEGKRIKDKHYVGHFGKPSNLFEHLTADFFESGHAGSTHVHVVADGAHWIWRGVEALIQEHQHVTMVLDYFHVSERLSELTQSLFTPGEAERQKDAAVDHLFEGRVHDFFELLTAWSKSPPPDAKDLVRENLTYFRNNQHRLEYKKHRDAGLPIGSGVIEGGVRFIGKDRLDRTGMRWSVPGAERILQLRCLDASNKWDSYWKEKAEKRKQTYFNNKRVWVLAA